MLKTSQRWNLHPGHLLCRRRNHTMALALRWVSTSLSHGDATLRVALERTYKTIPTTCLGRVKSTNILSVGSWRRAWTHTMTMSWRKKTLLCVSETSETGMSSSSSLLACLIIRLLWSGNYTLSKVWDAMTITNTLWNTGVETSSKAFNGWCGSQPTPSISLAPLSIAWTAICHQYASIPKCTLSTGSWRHRHGKILENYIVPMDVHSRLRVGDTLVPLIFMSDRTHVSNIARDMIEWPAYMTIRNLTSKICQMPPMHNVLMAALLRIPLKNHNIPLKWLDEQRRTNWEVLNEVLRRVLQPLTFKPNPGAESGYYNVLCPDGNFRLCKPVIAAWFEDCPECSDLHHLERHVSVWWDCPKNELRDYVPPNKQ